MLAAQELITHRSFGIVLGHKVCNIKHLQQASLALSETIVCCYCARDALLLHMAVCKTAIACRPMSYIGMLCLQGTWVLEQSRKEAEMASMANGVSSSPVRD